MVADRRLFLTLDKKQLVEEGDSRAAFLYCSPGQMINENEYWRLYKPDSEEVQTEAKAIEEAPENKAMLEPPTVKRTRKSRKQRARLIKKQ